MVSGSRLLRSFHQNPIRQDAGGLDIRRSARIAAVRQSQSRGETAERFSIQPPGQRHRTPARGTLRSVIQATPNTGRATRGLPGASTSAGPLGTLLTFLQPDAVWRRRSAIRLGSRLLYFSSACPGGRLSLGDVCPGPVLRRHRGSVSSLPRY